MKNLKLYFVESPCQREKILGREAKDYLFKELEGIEFQIVKDFLETNTYDRTN